MNSNRTHTQVCHASTNRRTRKRIHFTHLGSGLPDEEEEEEKTEDDEEGSRSLLLLLCIEGEVLDPRPDEVAEVLLSPPT